MSNCYCDVPLTYQTENNCHTHDNIVEVVNVIHCGIDENKVIRVARNDIELLPAPDVEPVQEWISVKDMLPENGGYVVCIAKRNPFSRFMPMVARIEKNGWVNPITEQYISEATHWMPIPVPQKGE